MGLFDKLESKLEQGVNGAFARAFKSEVQPVEIASGIRRAMDDRAASVGKGKRPIVPNLFTIELSPTDYDRLSAWGEELDDELIASAQEHADEQRYLPGGPLTIVLVESDTLETGVFRLRPATAKAADALAHQRNHPRPQRNTRADDSYGEDDRTADASNAHASGYDDASAYDADAYGSHGHDADDTHIAGAYAVSHDGYGHDADDDHAGHDDHFAGAGAVGATAGMPTHTTSAPHASGRSFGTRIKDYLLGTTTDTSAHGSHDDAARVDEADHHRDDEPGYLDDDAYDDGYDSDDTGFDDSHPDGRTYGGAYGRTPQRPEGRANERENEHDHGRRHAWDDDDSDDGDPTGFEPAPQAQAHRPRQMSPRERPWLKIDGQRYPLLGAITVLGRDDEADIVVDDPGVSRRHSEIRITHDGPHLVMSVRDLGSTNGTFVNGDRIDSTHVHDGDRLTLGRTPMTIHLGDRP